MLQQQNQQACFERDNLKTQLDKIETQHESVTTRLTDVLNELAKKEEAQKHWQDQSYVLTIKLDEQNKLFVR